MPRTALGRPTAVAVVKANRDYAAEDRFAQKLDDALRALAESAMGNAARSAVGRGDVNAFVGLLDWDTLTYSLADLQPDFGGSFLAEALTAFSDITGLTAEASFTLVEQRSINYARQRAGALITEITDQVRQTVATLVGDAIESGNTINVLTQQLRDIIPLNNRFATAVENSFERVRNGFLADGKTFDEATRLATESSQRYAARLRQVRSRAIARTEVMTASQAGRFEGWSAAIGGGNIGTDWKKEWITGGNPCPECDPLDGEIVGWDEPFSIGQLMPPLHIQCRCVGVLRAPSTATGPGVRKAKRRDPENPKLVVSAWEGGLLIESALAQGRTKTTAEHEEFVRNLLEER